MFAPQARFMVGMEGCRKQKGDEEKELRKGGRKGVGGLLSGGEGKRKGEKDRALVQKET